MSTRSFHLSTNIVVQNNVLIYNDIYIYGGQGMRLIGDRINMIKDGPNPYFVKELMKMKENPIPKYTQVKNYIIQIVGYKNQSRQLRK